jgi:MFS family permease
MIQSPTAEELPAAAPARAGALSWRQIASSVIGNALEWYDFTIYGYFAATIAVLFFPAGSATTSLLAALAVFGVSFVVRPLGGIAFSHFADLHGRKTVLVGVMILMSVGTALILVAPTYAAIGVGAPILIVIARVIQGISAGGEFSSVTAFLVEHAPPGRRGLYGGWQGSGQGAAPLLAGVVGFAVAGAFTKAELENWAWRLPFLVGLAIGPVGVYLRYRLSETPEFLQYQAARAGAGRIPFLRVLRNHKRNLCGGFGLVLGSSATVYVVFLFMPTYAARVLHLDVQTSFIAPAVAGLVLTLCCPITGHLSDRYGRRPVMLVSGVLFLASLFPGFIWLGAEGSNALRLAVVELIFAVLISGYLGPFTAAIAELYPVGVRATGISIAYNVGVGLFGGFAPFIVAWLIAKTGSSLAPAFYVSGTLSVSLVFVLFLPTATESSDARLASAARRQ